MSDGDREPEQAASTEIVWHQSGVTVEERRARNGHHSFMVWFTGLSGSGKSTLANALARTLFDRGIGAYVLDGDNTRFGLNNDLGFSKEDRKENIRRVGEVAKLFVDSGQVAVAALISPYREDRDRIRRLMSADEFIEVYVNCSLAACELRDVKGLYRKARSGELKGFTGIDAPYEEPEHAELTVDTEACSIDRCISQIIAYLESRRLLTQ